MTSPTLSEKIHRTLTELDLLQIDTNEAHQAIMEAIRESVPEEKPMDEKMDDYQLWGNKRWNDCRKQFLERLQ